MLYELLYTSIAVREMSEGDLEDLLADVRPKNVVRNITGLLVHDARGFMQLLEGEKQDVEEVFASIRKDARHRTVTVFHSGEIAARAYGDFSMAYRWVDPETGVAGIRDALSGTDLEAAIGEGTTMGARLLRILHESRSA